MTRKGHPRVPRAIRGERKRQERLARERYLKAVPSRRWKMIPVTQQGSVIHTTSDVLADTYDPMLRAALLGPTHLPVPMSQRG